MPGIDGIDRTEFANSIDVRSSSIADRIASNSYRFRELRPIAIPKDGDDIRLINVPTIEDRLVQRMLLKFLTVEYGDRWRIPTSFSSMGGNDEGVHRTIGEIGEYLTLSHFAIKADLSKYFDTIDRQLMADRITKLVRHKSIHGLLKQVINCETSTNTPDERGTFKNSGLVKGQGLRQGMPLSPVFAFLFLADIDQNVESGFYRYVDDLLFFSTDQEEVEHQFAKYRAAVEERGLKIHALGTPKNKPKTRLIRPKENFDFLGIRLIRRQDGVVFEIPRKSKERIQREITKAAELDRSDRKKQKRWALRTANKASNLVKNYQSAYQFCSDWDSFETMLKQHQIYMCRKLVRELTSIERSKNTELLRRVFGI